MVLREFKLERRSSPQPVFRQLLALRVTKVLQVKTVLKGFRVMKVMLVHRVLSV